MSPLYVLVVLLTIFSILWLCLQSKSLGSAGTSSAQVSFIFVLLVTLSIMFTFRILYNQLFPCLPSQPASSAPSTTAPVSNPTPAPEVPAQAP